MSQQLIDTTQIATGAVSRPERKSDVRALPRRTRVLAVVRHPVGGIRSYLAGMYGALARQHYQFRLATVEDSESLHLRAALDGPEIDFIEVAPRHALASLVRAVTKSLAGGGYDLIHSHGFTAGVVASVGNLFFRVPHVLTLHETLHAGRFKRPYGWIKAVLLARLMARIDVVQTVGFDARQNLITYLPGLRKSRIAVIMNGIDVDRFSRPAITDGGSWRAELGIPERAFLFGFLGRLMPEKGYEHLVDAVQLIAGDPAFAGRLVVLVVNDGCYIRELKADIEARGLSSYFRFIGLLPDVIDVIKRLDSVVMPSLREACPLVAMESLVAGCPLIASSCIGLREVIDGTPALPVTPGDPRALADAMTYLMQHHSEIKRTTMEFVPTAKLRYDVNDAAGALDVLFRGTLAKRSKSHPGSEEPVRSMG